MSAATVNGLTIEYEVHGPDDGEPLLLVMGLGGQLIAWPVPFVERFVAEGFRVIRFDNRDAGLSTHWPRRPRRPRNCSTRSSTPPVASRRPGPSPARVS